MSMKQEDMCDLYYLPNKYTSQILGRGYVEEASAAELFYMLCYAPLSNIHCKTNDSNVHFPF